MNRYARTRFKLTGCWPSVTLKLPHNLPSLKVPHLRQALDAVEQRVSSVLRGRERGNAKRVVWPCARYLPGARVPLFDSTICGHRQGSVVRSPRYTPDRVLMGCFGQPVSLDLKRVHPLTFLAHNRVQICETLQSS